MANGNSVNINGGPPPAGGTSLGPVHNLPPMPVLAVIVGGGLGLLAFAYSRFRAAQVTGAQGSASSPQQVQASVPVMLGSLQQSLLDLQGQVGSGVAGLTDAVSTSTSATNSSIVGAEAALMGNMTTVGGQLTDLITAQGQSYTDLLNNRASALQSAIAALGTQITTIGGGQDALSKAMEDAYKALQSDLSSVQTDISTVNQSVGGLQQQVQGVVNSQTAISGQLAGLTTGQPSPSPWAPYEGKIIAQGSNGVRADPGNTWTYLVSGGKLYGITSSAAFQRLSGISAQAYGTPGAADKYITTVGLQDAQLRGAISGVISA